MSGCLANGVVCSLGKLERVRFLLAVVSFWGEGEQWDLNRAFLFLKNNRLFFFSARNRTLSVRFFSNKFVFWEGWGMEP